jgi:Fic family protein
MFFLTGIHEQASDALLRIRRVQDLREQYRSRISQQARTPASLMRLVDLLFEQPVLTIAQVAQRLNVSYHTSNRYVTQLLAAGLLEETTHNVRNRVFRSPEIIVAIESPLNREESHAIRPL